MISLWNKFNCKIGVPLTFYSQLHPYNIVIFVFKMSLDDLKFHFSHSIVIANQEWIQGQDAMQCPFKVFALTIIMLVILFILVILIIVVFAVQYASYTAQDCIQLHVKILIVHLQSDKNWWNSVLTLCGARNIHHFPHVVLGLLEPVFVSASPGNVAFLLVKMAHCFMKLTVCCFVLAFTSVTCHTLDNFCACR